MPISMSKCKNRLATIWFVGAGLVFALMLLQTLLGHYESAVSKAWGWALPTVMPTLSLIIGVLVVDLGGNAAKNVRVDSFVFKLAASLSIVYLCSVLLTMLLQPLSPKSPSDALHLSNVWLGPFQGLVAAAIGAFFTRKGKGEQ